MVMSLINLAVGKFLNVGQVHFGVARLLALDALELVAETRRTESSLVSCSAFPRRYKICQSSHLEATSSFAAAN